MPAVSEAQRRYLYAHFGDRWVKRHHFNNLGKLPPKARPAPITRALARKGGTR